MQCSTNMAHDSTAMPGSRLALCSSVVGHPLMQVVVFQVTKHITGTGHRVFRMSPFHHHLELSGWSETSVVAAAYVSSLCLAAVAAYVALVSV